jgi:hypothetical protein
VLLLAMQLFCVTASRDLQQKAPAEAQSSLLSDQPWYFPTECQKTCTTASDFHVPLPSATSTVVGNAATQWATSLLIQVSFLYVTSP